MYRCNICGKIKDEKEFYKDKKAPHGHTWDCKECRIKRVKEWQASHPLEKHPRVPKKYYCPVCGNEMRTPRKMCQSCWDKRKEEKNIIHKEKAKIRSREAYRLMTQEQRDEKKRYAKEYMNADPERKKKHTEKSLQWQKDHPIEYWAQHCLNAKVRRGYDVQIDKLWLVDLAKQTPVCPICGKEINYGHKGDRKAHHNSPSIDRKENGNVVSAENTWIICHKCNTMKSDMPMSKYIEYCENIVRKFKIV